MKERKIGMMLLLWFVTFGIYYIVWHYKFQKELREESGQGIMAIGHLMIFLVPVVNIIYYIYWLCVVDKRLVYIGAKKGNRWWLYLLLSPIPYGSTFVPILIQNKANHLGTIDVGDSQKDKSDTELRVDKYAKYFNQ
ncbi:MAG: DUF4234 domain-containing protein [Clostridia bacterium]|nr:DUF4234 domain-containing protein [Clostridia bacterium]